MFVVIDRHLHQFLHYRHRVVVVVVVVGFNFRGDIIIIIITIVEHHMERVLEEANGTNRWHQCHLRLATSGRLVLSDGGVIETIIVHIEPNKLGGGGGGERQSRPPPNGEARNAMLEVVAGAIQLQQGADTVRPARRRPVVDGVGGAEEEITLQRSIIWSGKGKIKCKS